MPSSCGGADGVVELGGVDPGEADGRRFGGDGVELVLQRRHLVMLRRPDPLRLPAGQRPELLETGAHRDEERIVVVGDEDDFVVSLLPPRRGQAPRGEWQTCRRTDPERATAREDVAS